MKILLTVALLPISYLSFGQVQSYPKLGIGTSNINSVSRLHIFGRQADVSSNKGGVLHFQLDGSAFSQGARSEF